MTIDGTERTFSEFDPARGRGREVAKFASSPGSSYNWDLSPDGSRIAMLYPARGNRIRLLPLDRGEPRDLIVEGWSTLDWGPYWAPDGKGFYVSTQSARGATVLYIDLKAHATPIWEQSGGSWTWAIPSPDGRRLALMGNSVDSNVWMMEGF
jgi:Tol biopolymer transport system component